MSEPSVPLPLSGRRVLVTRSASQGADLRDRLRARGATVLHLPAIRFEARQSTAFDHALAALGDYDWLVLTSANAVRFLLARCTEIAATDEVDPLMTLGTADDGPRVAVVGSATQEALAAHGIPVDLVPSRFTGADLAAAMAVSEGARVLLPRAVGGRPEIAAALRARGAQVDDLPIYETLPGHYDSEALSSLPRGIDVLTFTSPSAVRNTRAGLAAQLSADVLDGLWRQPAVCIGPTTAEAARRLGLSVAAVAQPSTMAGLVDAVVGLWAGAAAGGSPTNLESNTLEAT